MKTSENGKLTPVSDLGEFGLIDRLTSANKITNKSTIKAVGDDAAVLEYGTNQTLVSTDILVENVHFDLVYTPLKHLGYKSAVVNFSDIYAMNGRPKQITIGLAVSSKFSVEAIEEIYEGIYLACRQYGVDMVGGDTTASTSGLVISITVVGEIEKGKVVYRNGAAENDLIFVSGDLGAAYMGLLLLEREKAVFKEDPQMQPQLDGFEYLLERQLKPEARQDIIQVLEEKEIVPTAMIDISDGLASDILHICTQSGVGCQIYENKIPINPLTEKTAKEFNIAPAVAAMNGGEDYELLFCVSQKDYETIKELDIAVPIGHITDKNSGVNLVGASGGVVGITAQGWDGLKKNI